MKLNILKELLRTKQTIFSFKELLMIMGSSDVVSLRKKLIYYVRTGELYHIRRGLYAKDEKYDRYELATKILTPSYISFETVLLRAGIVFQFTSQIFVASYTSRTLILDGQEYIFRTIKAPILTNTLGVEIRETYSIATPERAFLDMLYIHKDYYFDNEASLDWKKVFEILPIYNNKRMTKIVNEHFKEVTSERTVHGT